MVMKWVFPASLAAIFVACSLHAASPLQIEHDVMVGMMVSDRFSWIDSFSQPRVAVLAHNDGQFGPPAGIYANRGGALREFRYQLPSGTTRICGVTGYGNGGFGGFGYVVSHPNNSTCIGGSDSAPLGYSIPGQFLRVFEGRHHAIFRFAQNYVRNCSTTLPVQQRTVPVTIDWLFSTGHDHPLWAVTYDLSAIPVNTLFDDSRAPYGELNIDGSGVLDVDGVAWGDRYKFTTTTAPAAMSSEWTWDVPNTVPWVKLWIVSADATMGIVQTQTMDQQDAGGGRNVWYHDLTPFWGTTSAAGNAGGPDRMPWQDSWPYQSNSYSVEPSSDRNNARLSWGTQYGFLGQQLYDVHDGVAADAPGWPKKSYSTYVVVDTHSKRPIEEQVAQVETISSPSLVLSATTGSVIQNGPAGIARLETVTYSPPGYNHVYGALAFLAAGNRLDANIAVGAGTLSMPLFIISNYTGGPPTVRLDGVTLVADVDYFASIRTAAGELWFTLNRDLTGASNHLEIGCTSGSGPGRVARLKGVKAAPADALFAWDFEPSSSGGYRLYAVDAKELIPQANLSQAPVCTAPAGQLDCTHSGALPSPPPKLFYQVVGVCANGADEGPL